MGLTAYDIENAMRRIAEGHPTGNLHAYCGIDAAKSIDDILHPLADLPPSDGDLLLHVSRLKFRWGSLDIHVAPWVANDRVVITGDPILAVLPER